MRAKYLIIGGGVMGTSIALHLARRSDPVDEPVVLLERTELAAGSSGRSGAILRTMYADRPLASMARDSLREYAGFQVRTGRSVGFRRAGVLTLAGPEHPEWCERIAANVEMMVSLGIEAQLLDAAGVRDVAPGIGVVEGTVGGWEPEAGFVDPVQAVEAFAALARTYGAATRLGVEVTALRIEGGRVVGVETTAGDWEAEAVVVVAGPWTGAFLERHGVELPLSVVRPQGHFLAMPGAEESVPAAEPADAFLDPLERLEEEGERGESAGSPIAHPVVIDLEYGFYARCDPVRARTRVGHVDYAHDEPVPDPGSLDEEVTEEVRRWSRDTLRRRFPIYRDQPDAGSQAAMYTLTPDAQAVIGPVGEVEGLFVVTGFSGHGFKLAPSVGLGVSQMVCGEPVSAFDPEFFSPNRFGEEASAAAARVKAFGL